MTTTFTWWTPGEPKGQPRPRAVNRGARAGMYDPGTADAWRKLVERHGRHLRPVAHIVEPVRMVVHFFLPRPQRLMGKKHPDGPIPALCKPDADNLAKAVMDELTEDKKKGRIGWWKDDSIIFQLDAQKFYHSKTGKPGASIRIEINPQPLPMSTPETRISDPTDRAEHETALHNARSIASALPSASESARIEAKMKAYEESQADPHALPAGKTCADCMHFKRCETTKQTGAGNESCIYLPSRFRLPLPLAK